MKNAVYVSVSQQMVLRKQMEAIAQNIANVSTPAYKSERVLFEEYLVSAGDGTTVTYANDTGVKRDFTPGRLERTGNDLDIGFSGDGYFVVETADGNLYSRIGHFQLDNERNIVTGAGDKVLGEDGEPIALGAKATNVTIARDGTISSDAGPVGRIMVVTFEKEANLVKQGGGLFASNDVPIELEPEETKLHQGMLESSNVDPILEMTRMIDVLRSYQSTQRLQQTDHDLQRRAIQDITALN
jgi:flagellar basal-body rod protein FlgF